MQADSPTLQSLRRDRGLTQEQLAAELGVRSKGYISRLENGEKPITLQLAVRIEQWSGGVLRASELCPQAAGLIRQLAAGAAE